MRDGHLVQFGLAWASGLTAIHSTEQRWRLAAQLRLKLTTSSRSPTPHFLAGMLCASVVHA